MEEIQHKQQPQQQQQHQPQQSQPHRGPTDRSLPPFDPSTDPILADFAECYSYLTRMERKLDWNYSRKRVEMAEQLSDKGSTKLASISRTLRIRISNTCSCQAWQQSSNRNANNLDNQDGSADVLGNTSFDPNGLPDFSSGQGIPSWNLSITGQLLPNETNNEAIQPAKFTSLIRNLTVYLDRPSEMSRDPNIVTFTPDFNDPYDTMSLSQTGSENVNARISIQLDQKPEKFKLHPDLARVLGFSHETVLGTISALWSYVKKEKLQDNADKRVVKTDATLQKLFGTDKILFHQFPELVQRCMTKADPIVLNYTINVGPNCESKDAMYDIDFELETSTKMRLAFAYQKLFNENKEDMDTLKAADEKIATNSATVRSGVLKRDFLQSFATSPVDFINTWLDSQAQDLDMILGSDRAQQQATSADESVWRSEKRRRADFWKGDWLLDSINVHQVRSNNGRTTAPPPAASATTNQYSSPQQYAYSQQQQHHQQQQQQQPYPSQQQQHQQHHAAYASNDLSQHRR